jgi:peptidoglycan-N-acetylglucosamine deacetylase
MGNSWGMRRRQFLALFGGGAVGSLAGAGLARARLQREPQKADPDEEAHDPRSGQVQIIWSVETKAPLAALTFDDGPDPEFTPRILDLLDRYGARATFLAMGYNAARHPGLLREVVAAGHEIGNHTWSHLNLAHTSPTRTQTEIERGAREIEDRAGVPIRFFRPPYGRLSEAVVRVLAPLGHDVLQYSQTRGGPSMQSVAQVVSHVGEVLGPGDILLLHDGIGRGTFQRDADFAQRLRHRRHVELKALTRILENARARGLGLGTASELLAAGPEGENTGVSRPPAAKP